jgi:hypothetical protein
MNKDFVHAKDEHFYVNVNKDTIANQVFHNVITYGRKIQSILLFVFINIQ